MSTAAAGTIAYDESVVAAAEVAAAPHDAGPAGEIAIAHGAAAAETAALPAAQPIQGSAVQDERKHLTPPLALRRQTPTTDQ